MSTMDTQDRVLNRRELKAILGLKSSETIRRMLKLKRLPEPDVKLSQRIVGWRISTLRAAGINVA